MACTRNPNGGMSRCQHVRENAHQGRLNSGARRATFDCRPKPCDSPRLHAALVLLHDSSPRSLRIGIKNQNQFQPRALAHARANRRFDGLQRVCVPNQFTSNSLLERVKPASACSLRRNPMPPRHILPTPICRVDQIQHRHAASSPPCRGAIATKPSHRRWRCRKHC